MEVVKLTLRATLGLVAVLSALLLPSVCAYSDGFTSNSMTAEVSQSVIVLNFQRPIEGFMVINTTVMRSLPTRVPGARRYIEVPVYIPFKVSGSQAFLPVPAGVKRFSILGPFSREEPLTPFIMLIDEKTLANSTALTLEWPVVEGFAVTVNVLPLLDGRYPDISVEVQMLELEQLPYKLQWLTPNYQMLLGRSVPELSSYASRFILPPLGRVEVSVRVLLKGRMEVLKRVFDAQPNASLTIEDVANLILLTNRKELSELRANVSNLLDSLESSGYYLGSSRRLLSMTESLAVEDGSLQVAYGQRLAYSLLSKLEAYLVRLEAGPSITYALLLTGAEMLLCLMVGLRLSQKWALKVVFSLVLFAVLWFLTFQVLPKASMNAIMLTSAAAVMGAFLGLRVLLRQKPVQTISTASGATLEGLISSTINFSVSFLARRRLRAILLFITTALMAFGTTCLTSFTMHTAVSHQISEFVPETIDGSYLIARGYGFAAFGGITPVNVAGLAFLASRSEVQSISPSAIAVFPMNPYDTVRGLPISGVFGITQNSPVAMLMENCCMVEGSALGIHSGAIIISDALAKAASKKVGDVIEIGGSSYTVVGVFDSRALTKVKDLDGDDLLPTIMVGTSSYKPPAESVVFLYYGDAVLVGAVTNKVYVKLTPESDSATLARVLSLLGNVNVYVAEAGKPTEIYYPGFRIEIVGLELLIPSLIALLIVYMSFLGFVYEVRRDIFTLSTLGATPDQVFLVFVMMASVIGFAGGVLGYLTGLTAFRGFSATRAEIPVDVKLDTASFLLSIILPTVLALLGALSPATKAVVAAVPSLRRRWRVEAEESSRDDVEREVTLVTPIPVVVRSKEKARELAEFLESKLTEMAGNKVSVYNVSGWIEGNEERPAFVVYFEYLQVEGRAFKSYNKVRIKRVNGEYAVELESKIVTIYTMFAKECLRDVASLVRKLTLEWRAQRG
ncbi:MAG: FtsX-like permease family protein [Candidatus Nezhaarchaeales archaeon]